jgi:hypothetical protein
MMQSVSVRSHPPRNWIVLEVPALSHVHLLITRIPCEYGQALRIWRFTSSDEKRGEQNRALARVGVVERYR